MGTVYRTVMKSYMLQSAGSLHSLSDYKLNNSGLLKLYPDVRVANYGNTHKGGLSLLLPFPTRLKTGK